MTHPRSEQLWARLFSEPAGVRAFPEARRIPLALIDTNPDQPRREFAGIEELAAHIRQFGLLQPVVVARPVGGRYTLVAGGRRLAAFQWLAEHDAERPERWHDIPAVERDVETTERLVLAVAENVARQNLSDAEVITAIRLLHDLHGWSQSEIARRLGVSRQWISQYFQAASDPALAAHIQTGQLSAAKAYEVQRAKSPPARAAAEAAALRGATLREIRDLAQRESAAPSAGAGTGAAAADQAASTTAALPAATAVGTASGEPLVEPVAEAATNGPATASVELSTLRATAMIRACIARGITRMPVAPLLQALREDLQRLEQLAQPARLAAPGTERHRS